jgi:hypothetical protein
VPLPPQELAGQCVYISDGRKIEIIYKVVFRGNEVRTECHENSRTGLIVIMRDIYGNTQTWQYRKHVCFYFIRNDRIKKEGRGGEGGESGTNQRRWQPETYFCTRAQN